MESENFKVAEDTFQRYKENVSDLTQEFELGLFLYLVNKIKFINSFSFIFSPRPGTKAAELEINDKDKLKSRLITIQEKLFNNQIELNKSLEGKTLEVLVENKLKNQNKFFGRNKFLNSVIFDGNESHIGKLIKVNIEKSNQNSLFGKVTNEMKAA